jgi:leader peptidase (prepilin peptidase)/N-methyltransferase
MQTVLLVLALPLGLILGGFVTMVADRVPDGLPVLRPGPRCPDCEHPLGAVDVIPVVSWFLRRGRCRWCDERIGVGVPVVEVVTASSVLVAVLEFGDSWVVLPFLVFYPTLVAVSVVDLFHYRIPDRITFPAFGLCLALIAAVSVGYGEAGAIGWALAGAAIFFLGLFVPHLVSPAGMGFGDVKLALLLGLHIGWISGSAITIVRLVLFTLIIASAIGVVVGLSLGALRRRGFDLLPDPEDPGLDPEAERATDPADADRDVDAEAAVVDTRVRTASAAFPFGPALAVGTVLTTLFAEQLIGG